MIYTIAQGFDEPRHIISPWQYAHEDITLCGVMAEAFEYSDDNESVVTGAFGGWLAGVLPLEVKDQVACNYCPACQIVRRAIYIASTSGVQQSTWQATNTPDQLSSYYHGNLLEVAKLHGEKQLKPDGPLFSTVNFMGSVNGGLVYDGSDYGKKIEAKRALVKYVDTILLAASFHACPPLACLFDRRHNGYFRFINSIRAYKQLPSQFRSVI